MEITTTLLSTGIDFKANLGFIYFYAEDDVLAPIRNLWAFAKPILNVLVILAGAYGIFNNAIKVIKGDQQALQSLGLVVGGILIWFIGSIAFDTYLKGTEDASKTGIDNLFKPQ